MPRSERREEVRRGEKTSSVPVAFVALGVAGPDGERLPSEIGTVVYRVVQEALNNAAKYACGPDVPADARATHVAVTLQRHQDAVQTTVEDNGPGFDPEGTVPSGRLGLVGMRERAELAGGSLEIETAPGEGTTIFLRLPLSGSRVSG